MEENIHKKKWTLSQSKNIIIALQCLTCLLNCAILAYPQGLQTFLLESPYNLSNFQYGLFYGISSFPNIILPLFVGIYLDRYGYNWIIIAVLEAMLLIGSFTVMLGCYEVSYPTMIIGQLIMGTGSENLQVLLKRFVLKIASIQESVLLNAFLLISVRLGIMLACYLSPLLYEITGSVGDTYVSAMIMTILICLFFNISYILSENSDFLERNLDGAEETQNMLCEQFSWWGSLKKFFSETNVIYWLCISLIFSFFILIYGFLSEGNNYIVKSLKVDATQASYFLVYYYSVVLVSQLIFGYIFERIGYYLYSMILGAISQIAAMIIFIEIYGTIHIYTMLIPLGFLAVGYSFCSTFLFSCTGFIVKKQYYGIAYGVIQCGIDFGGVFGPLIFGLIKDSTLNVMDGYFWSLIEILGFIGFNLITSLVILVLDFKNLKVLSKKKKT